MNQHQFVTVTRTLVKRGMSDIERKITASFATGAAGYAALNLLAAYHITLPPTVAPLIPYGCALIGGYVTHSLGATTTFRTDDSGHLTQVSTATGSIKIPVQAIPQPRPANPAPIPVEPSDPVPVEVPDQAPAVVNTSGDSVSQIINGPATDQSTAIIDPLDRYAAVLGRLPSAQTEPDGH